MLGCQEGKAFALGHHGLPANPASLEPGAACAKVHICISLLIGPLVYQCPPTLRKYSFVLKDRTFRGLQ